ncbi:septum site-determining protein Ssd [Streptomyces sp. DSM 118878]
MEIVGGVISRDRSASSDGRQSGPLILTEDVELLDDLLRLCAAAGARPEVHHGGPGCAQGWDSAPLVLVGDDAADRVRGAARRRGVVLVGRDQDDSGIWRRAVEIGADHVLLLPDGEQWLVDRIADVAEGVGRPALTVGVIGGRGGAGASTLACALAVTAARSGRRTMLVDADPLGGGLDVLLGGETADGLRWPAFAASRGRVGGEALEESLPELHALRVLSWDRGEAVAVAPEAVRAVVSAARRRGGVVVVDLPRRVDEPVAEALAQVDLGLLVVPPELRAVAGARRVASTAGLVLRDLRVVVGAGAGPGGPSGRGGLDSEEVARLLGLPLAGDAPWEAGLAVAQAAGVPPGGCARGPLARFCDAFWGRVPADAVGGGV